MKNKVTLSSVALLIGGIALSGCAPKQAWSPELEDARAAYQRAASNPLVTSLAAAELDEAQRQLRLAEDAADYFKGREAIAHEATLAQLKAAEAEQAARGLQAKENLRLAQAGAPVPQQPIQQQVIPNQMYGYEPAMAAATSYAGSHIGSMSGGSSTEAQQIAQQIAALSRQIAQLQSRVANGTLQSGAGFNQQPVIEPGYTETMATVSPIVSFDETEIKQDAYIEEPAIGAARPTLDTSSAIYPESGNDIQSTAYASAPAVVSDARLREELRAMNARPSESGMTLTLGERYFESGSARLWNGRAARHLDNIAAVMVENPGLAIDIEAHTDNQGSAEQNDNLSADRAIAIKSALVLRGVDGGRMNATGFGDSSPVTENDTPLGRLQNRRVEIIFPNVEGL